MHLLWHADAQRRLRSSSVHCFDISGTASCVTDIKVLVILSERAWITLFAEQNKMRLESLSC